MDAADNAVLPLRPLTVGELLDASVALLRRCGAGLLVTGLLLAAGQQALVAAVRAALSSFPLHSLTDWIALACWLGTESMILAVLAAPAAATAATLLVEPRRRSGRVVALAALTAPGRRWPGVLAAAAVLGVLAAGGVLLCGVGWLVVYGLTGLVVPVLVTDRAPAGAAVTRPLRLVFRGGCRPAGIRLLAYLGWLAIRLAVGYVGGLLLHRFAGEFHPMLLTQATWLVVDAVAYPALACLDACVHLENRIRTEGLDLALGRVRGADPGSARAVLEAI